MARLRERILELGGIQAANSYVKINLSLFGLYPREHCPSIPPEVVLLPFNFLYQMSSWTRAIIVSLGIVHAADPRRPVPAGFTLDEIWRPASARRSAETRALAHVAQRLPALDRLVKWWERDGSKAIRRRAIEAAREWMIERLDHSDGLGAIYPPMMYSVMALDVLGYATDDPVRVEALRQFDRPDGGRRRALLLPAVLFAGVGYGHRGLCPGAEPDADHAGAAARGRLAAGARSAAQGRLGGQAARRGAFRVGLRI